MNNKSFLSIFMVLLIFVITGCSNNENEMQENDEVTENEKTGDITVGMVSKMNLLN